MISERLRATAGKGQGGPLKAEAAEVIDALVAALEKAADFIQPFNRAEALMDEIDAALALARKP
jgi:hypothetical protein